jgi:hypothetical protein
MKRSASPSKYGLPFTPNTVCCHVVPNYAVVRRVVKPYAIPVVCYVVPGYDVVRRVVKPYAIPVVCCYVVPGYDVV